MASTSSSRAFFTGLRTTETARSTTVAKREHKHTKSSRLRTTVVKLSCYLNGEADHSRATVIRLPEECDTLGEVLPKIQQQMQLDKRMSYAAQLFLPNGDEISTYKALIDAAALDTAIIVACGEPFDPSSIPYDLLEFHLQASPLTSPDLT